MDIDMDIKNHDELGMNNECFFCIILGHGTQNDFIKIRTETPRGSGYIL